MKKAIMMLALLVIPFALQAQTKFHDVEAKDATGPVKSMTENVMGRSQITTFSPEGKMQVEGMSDATYDADGYIQSSKMTVQDMQVTVKYIWENGKVKAQTISMMGQEMKATRTFDEKGNPATESMNMMGQDITTSYKDYKFDSHGNWISRQASIMGQEMEQTRTIEYYE